MSERPTDHLAPSSKRRPGAQLTKDDAEDNSDEAEVRRRRRGRPPRVVSFETPRRKN